MITRKPSRGDPLGVAELDPVHVRVGKQAVEQDHRPALAKLVIGEFDPVRRVPVRTLARSSRKVAGRFDPFVDQLLMLVGAHFRQAFGVQPGAVDALGAEMMLSA